MTGQRRQRPLIFLDVDGTLIPYGSNAGAEPGAAVSLSSGSANPLLARLNPEHGAKLLALGCELVWATSWGDEANGEICGRLNLPTLTIVDWQDEPDDVSGSLHWKTKQLVAWAAGRTFVWIDDEITDSDRAWVSAHHRGQALLHRVIASRGLTDTDFSAIATWLTPPPTI